MTKDEIKALIVEALENSVYATSDQLGELIPDTFGPGKLYEAYVLAEVCRNLRIHDGCRLTLIGGDKIVLKSSPGAINYKYPYIKVEKNSQHIANIWTDIEFQSLSSIMQRKAILTQGDFHEIDIAIVSPLSAPRPTPEQVMIAVECKNTAYKKSYLRESLGMRRELSYLGREENPTFFKWPKPSVRLYPPSCIAIFSTDRDVLNYESPGNLYGISFYYHPM